MPIARKHAKQDIRLLTNKDLKVDTSAADRIEATSTPKNQNTLVHHDVKREMRAIAWCSIPLIMLLVASSYLDTTRHWVVPFAAWLMQLGS